MFFPSFTHTHLPLEEYPRPQFKRDSYFSLNGEWDYAINKCENKPFEYDGKIIVPFSPEAKLSGVNKQVLADDFLHYRKIFSLPDKFNKGRLFINFGACDQICKVYLNGFLIGSHEGGYNSFTFEISDYILDGANELYVLVVDDASSDIYGRGKQKYKRGGIWYTATSGIWQSVWIESTPLNYLKNIKIKPDFDTKTLALNFSAVGEHSCCVAVFDGDKLLLSEETSKKEVVLNVSDCEEWTPERPKLYTLKLTFGTDEVLSYFGMRKFSTVEIAGKKYFALNNRPYFNNGLLDQGYWHEGLYTPPSNKAMFDELASVKRLGFNLLRKHIKVEPMLWYYYCDVLGILVWQDMINGGGEYPFYRIALAPFINLRLDDTNYKAMKRSMASREQYYKEAEEMIEQLYNCVSLCLWTPFNEAWGQFDAIKTWERLKIKDDTRLYDHASGWQDMGGGDLRSRHIYFRKAKMKNDGKRILALTEFGGYSYAVNGHVFSNKKFGYKGYKSKQDLQSAYENLYKNEIIPAIINDGLCATVYTQLTDVEDEINGLYTYDRILKFDEEFLQSLNSELYKTFTDRFLMEDKNV